LSCTFGDTRVAQSGIVVEVQIADAFRRRVRPELFKRSAVATLRHQGATGPAELTVVLTDDQIMRELNRTYGGVDATTDVLAFGMEEVDEFAFSMPPDASRYLGDVIVSFPRAEAQAQAAGHPVEAELQLLTVHGVLHLLGHDHALPGEEAVMWAAQSEILQQL
jgi:probable rRNA maturation factor